MAPATNRIVDSPSVRAAAARERLNLLSDDRIVYVDRVGPRILTVPPNPTLHFSRQTLRDLDKGNLTGLLSQGARFLSRRMTQCPEITVSTNGHYTVQKTGKNPQGRKPRAFTVKTLNIWTGEPGVLHQDRDIEDLTFYSVGADLLPSYHSWKSEKLERRESSLELEQQQESALAEEEFGKIPKSMADLIDEYKEKSDAKINVAISNDPKNMLRIRPDILPSDPAWEGVEEYFKWILQFEREENPETPRVYRVLEDEMLESQRLLAVGAINSGYRAKVQDENTKMYHESLQTTFKGKPDNLTTKLTMLCFGLPTEPLTLTNVKFAGGSKDMPLEDNEDAENGANGQIMERITWSEKPLEFLHRYNERSYGYPMIRTEKRRHEEVDSDALEKILAQAERITKHPRLQRDQCGYSMAQEWEQSLHMRGGAGEPSGIPHRRYWIYTEMGRFLMDIHNSFGAFVNLTGRLYCLASKPKWACQIDLVQEPSTTTISPRSRFRLKKQSRWQWTQDTKYEHQPQTYESYVNHVAGSKNALRFHMRYNPNYPDELNVPNVLEPQGSRHIVNLELEDVGIAYWHLPTRPDAVNMLQDTFRNAIECLIPQHKMYRVDWSIKGTVSTGQLTLIAEAPSIELWKAMQEALGTQARVTIHISVIEDPQLQSNPPKVRILMPGFNQVGWYNIKPKGDHNWEIFGDIRNTALQKTVPNDFPVRIWAGVENYDNPSHLDLSMVLPARKDLAAEEDIWYSLHLALTVDAVVIRPEFEHFKVICLTGPLKEDVINETYPSLKMETDRGLLSLDHFRECVKSLWERFNVKVDYICIEQSQSSHTFFVGPLMTEPQWQHQVFDWLDSPNIAFRIFKNWEFAYTVSIIRGPLGDIISGVLPQTQSEQKEDTPQRTPPLGSKRLRAPKRTENAPLLTQIGIKRTEKQIANEPLVEVTTTWPSVVIAPVQVITTRSSPIKAPTAPLHIVNTARPVTNTVTQSTKVPHSGGVTTTRNAAGTDHGFLTPKAKAPSTGMSGVTVSRPDPFSQPTSLFSSEEYRGWRQKQTLQEVARVEAYCKDESIYTGDGGAAIPMFGPALEGNISASGRALPTIYTSVRTPSENLARDHELQALRKIVLERLEYCGTCQAELPGRDHNLEKQERHFEEHRQLEIRARKKLSQNAGAHAIVPSGEVFHCEYCGKTPAEFEEDDDAENHGPTCARLAIFYNVPHFCQYCRLDFWDYSLSEEAIETHLQNCANNRRFSLNRQIDLYQKLLSRAVGNVQPNGEFRCHFQGCNQVFNSATSNFDRADHFLNHLEHNDQEVNINKRTGICPFADCNELLSVMTQEDVVSHLREHIGWDDADSCPIPKCGMQLGGLNIEQLLIHLMEHISDENEVSVHCPFVGCDKKFTNWTAQQIITHINMDFYRNICPFPGCDIKFARLSDEEIVAHLTVHVAEHPIQCPFEGCCPDNLSEWSQQQILTHINMHLEGSYRRCPFRGCGMELAKFSPQKDREHLLGHVLVPLCPFPICRMALKDLTEEQKIVHLRTHLGPKRDLSTYGCPFEGCTANMKGWTNELKLEHMSKHSFRDGKLPLTASLKCPFDNCSQDFTKMSQKQITKHLHTQHVQAHQKSSPGIKCPLCTFVWDGTDETIFRLHFYSIHYLENPADFVCPICSSRVTNTRDLVLRHYENHVADSFCTWEGCHHRYEPGSTTGDRRKHLLIHGRQICQWPECTHIARENASTADVKKHLLWHVHRSCPWPNCDYLFPENVAQHEREQHLQHDYMLVHFEQGNAEPLAGASRYCPWLDCNEDFDDTITARQIARHLLDHSSSRCPFPGCYQEWGKDATPDDIRQHIQSHAVLKCPMNGCGHVLTSSMTDDEKIRHVESHFLQQCRVPGCDYFWNDKNSVEEWIGHILTHRMDNESPIGHSSTGDDFVEEDQNNIPPRLKAHFFGYNFYCPHCLIKVSGGNASACQRHRKHPCNIIGHDHWLVGMDNDRVIWKAHRDAIQGAIVSDTKISQPMRRNPTDAPPQKDSRNTTSNHIGSGSRNASGIKNGRSDRFDPSYKPQEEEEEGGGTRDAQPLTRVMRKSRGGRELVGLLQRKKRKQRMGGSRILNEEAEKRKKEKLPKKKIQLKQQTQYNL